MCNSLHPDCCHYVVFSKPFRSSPDDGRSGRRSLIKTRVSFVCIDSDIMGVDLGVTGLPRLGHRRKG